MNAVLDVVRLQLLDRRLVLGTGIAVLVFVAFGVGITAADVAASGSFGKGAAFGIVGGFYGGIAGAQATAITRLLPFAVAMGRTRREFYLGTLVFVVGEALVIGLTLFVLLGVERLTGGWGAGLSFLGTQWAAVDNPLGQYLVFTAPLLLTFPMIMLGAAVFVRWRRPGLLLAAVLAGLAGFATLIGVGLSTVDTGPAVLTTSLLLALGAVFAVAAWFVVRRTPV